ncbi:HD-GYP domain-containing protein [Ferviditalea candida]|uniref:HD-GYP domain-containing protein n=1 Tax=Ferviditalea candida TaxID=3108399 RepID=A0ABU5ZIU6_9BACL|nr:HD-GYP domain-containing protein [Paenibacillaceae bacterium T2]
MRVHIYDLQIGDRLASNVFNDSGLHVLSNGKMLDAQDINKLFNHRIDYVEIHRRLSDDSSLAMVSKAEESARKIQPFFDLAVDGAKDLFEQVVRTGKFDAEQIHENFDPLVESFNQETDVVQLLLSLNGKDDYTFHHSVQVGMISYYLAKWLGKSREESLFTGKAGYLHDIGKSRIDSAILNKPSKLTPEEYESIKQHTLIGRDIIENSMGASALSLAALQHHERLNGSGYPHGIRGDQMHPVSKIVAVADVYSAMISSRVYQQKRDLLVVLKELHRLSFSELDPFIVQTFIRNMIPNFLGKSVSLSTGEIGKIVFTNPSDFFRPLVQVEDKFIDLADSPQIDIEMIFL